MRKTLKQPRHRNVLGVTLTEIAIVLGVFGLMLGALWSLASTVMKHVKREQFSEQVMFIVKNVRSHYMGRIGITGGENSLTPDLVALGIFPKEMVVGTKVKHPWGDAGTGTVFISQDTMDDDQKFRLVVRGLTQDACISVARHLTSSGPSGVVGAEVNGTKITTLPLTVTAAKGVCASGNANVVSIVYRLRISSQ